MGKLGVGEVFFQCMKKFEDNIAQYIVDTDEKDTYGELLTRCVRTALRLKDIGITPEDVISSCTHNHKNSCVPYIATQFIGAVAATFHPNLSALDTIHLLKLTRPRVMFVSPESVRFITECLKETNVTTEVVVFGPSLIYTEFSEYLQPHPDEDIFEPEPINDITILSTIFFSSGTTGCPKGICLSHKSLLSEVATADILHKDKEGHQSSFVTLLYFTCYWISASLMLTHSIVSGGARVVCANFDAAEARKIIEKYKVKFVFLAPYQAVDILLVPNKCADVSSLSVIGLGGCAVSKKLMDDLRETFPNVNLINGYGQTENAGLVASFNPTNPGDMEMQCRKPESCGRITKFEWKVVDPVTEERLGPNEKGELRYKSEFIMNGYYKMDSSSAFDSEGYFKTGDIVYYDYEECIFVVDRIKEMFKYREWPISTAIIEDFLMNHPAVKEAVVIGVPNEADGEHPMALVVLHDSHEGITTEDIERFVEERVEGSQRLRAGVKFIKEIVRTTTGKIRRNIMRQLVLDGKI